ncbi:hypothetical protein LTR95_019519, partial [Oleoguttula sp. CCFEE 5521]
LGTARKTTASVEELPITNAGPNAKVNIKRSGDGPIRAVPPPGEKPPKLMTKEEFGEMWSRLVDKETSDEERAEKAEVERGMQELRAEIEEEARSGEAEGKETAEVEVDGAASETAAEVTAAEADGAATPPGTPPAPIDTAESPAAAADTAIVPPAVPANPDSFSTRVASVLKEEFGLDEAEELERRRIADLHAAAAAPPAQADSPPPEDPAPVPEPLRPQRRAILTRIADYFWGDIIVPNTPETLPAAPEIRLNLGEVAPAVPAPEQVPAADPVPEALDPEVLAAAEQAGLDADAMDDAEDIEGILELVGMQGPLVGLFQTAMFCLLLVISTILLAVVLPYLFGKTVLSVLDSPLYFLVALPLRLASHVADVTVDLAAMIGGGLMMAVAAFALRLHKYISIFVTRLPSASWG